MAKFYSKERAKYGNLTGQVIIWPVEYEGNPTEGSNPKNLPAGYLKCDGSKYLAEDYPVLAAILGTGDNTAFMKKKLDNTNFETINDNQFMVPDFGSKYPEPTTGANSGVYNNIRLNNSNSQEVSRSGIAIEATNQTGSDTASITYSGDITLPAQEIPITGKPGYTYGGSTHRTDEVSVEEDALHPHMHVHSATRARNMTRFAEGANATETNDNPRREGVCGNMNATTINVYDWLWMTRFDQSSSVTVKNGYSCTGAGSGKIVTATATGGGGGTNCTTEEVAKNPSDSNAQSTNPPGSRQEVCKAMVYWNPNDGTSNDNQAWYCQSIVSSTGYYGGCIEGATQYEFKAGCIQAADTWYDCEYSWGSPNNQTTCAYKSNAVINVPFIGSVCLPFSSEGNGGPGQKIRQPATYVAGLTNPTVPVDFAGNSLADVLPLQSNLQYPSQGTGFTALEHTTYDTVNLTQATDPTIHQHRIDIDATASHTYKVRTEAIAVNPENLSTTMDIGTDSSPSIDGATAPFIIMEYLIKT